MTPSAANLTLILLVSGLFGACAPSEPGPEVRKIPDSAGRKLYLSRSCADCHGNQRQGTRIAPSLQNLDEYWTEETLTVFLRDPSPVIARTPRLIKLDEAYPSDMPAMPAISETALDRLVRYLLHLEDQ